MTRHQQRNAAKACAEAAQEPLAGTPRASLALQHPGLCTR